MPTAETSLFAHDKVKSDKTDKAHQDIIYDALLKRPNRTGTCSDIAVSCNLDYVQVGKRMSELLSQQRVEIASKTGGRTGGGNPCRIYRALVTEEVKTSTEQPTLF